jgi:hypothetical protein
MALIVIAADKGAPGVTTTALALAAVWPRPVLLAECDPAGGDLVYRFPAADGSALDPRRGLLSLAVAARRGLQPGQVWEHTQKLSGGLDVLTGVINAEQGSSLGSLWEPLGDLFAALSGGDVIADCGRLGPEGPQYDLLAKAAVVLLVTRPNPGDVIRLRDRAGAVAAAGNARGRRGAMPAVVVIADQKTLKATAAEVGDTLAQGNVPARVLGGIADDDKGAELLSGEWGGRLDKTMLIRTAREIAQQLTASLPGARDDAGPQSAPATPQQAQSQYPPGQQYPPGPQQGQQQPYPPSAQQQYAPAAPQYPPAQRRQPPAAQQYLSGQPQGQQQGQQGQQQSQQPRGTGGGRHSATPHSASAQPAGAGQEAGEGGWTTA